MPTRVTEADAKKLFMQNKLKPLVPFPGTQKGWKSRCLVTGNLVSPTYGKVRDFGHRCKYCSRGAITENQALTRISEKGFKPLEKFPGTNSPWKIMCIKCQKETKSTFWSIDNGLGCKYCSKRVVTKEEAVNRLAKKGFVPLESFQSTTKPWLVRCKKCNRETRIKLRSESDSRSCKYCSKRYIDESVYNPVLEKLHLEPLVPFPGARQPWKLKCTKCMRVVRPSWTHLTRSDRNVKGCSFCSRRKISGSQISEILKKNHLKAMTQYINSKTPLHCICSRCKRSVYPRIGDLMRGQGGCIYCAGLRIDEKKALKLAKDNGFTPLTKYPGANVPWLCRCDVCGEISKPRYTSMQQGENRCKFCAKGGFDFNLPAYVYLMTNEKMGAHKIGISGGSIQNKRILKHQKQGWVLYRTMRFNKGIQAHEVEQKIILWLRNEKSLFPYLATDQMPQAGWTETVDSTEIHLEEIWKKVLSFKKILSNL